MVIRGVCLAGLLLASAGETAMATAPSETERSQPASDAAQQLVLADASGEHPLEAVLRFAEQQYKAIRNDVHDYRCVVVKRERIGRRLQKTRWIEMKVRRRAVRGGRVVSPYSVYMHYRAPKEIEGRQILFVEDRSEGKMLVRKGGSRFDFVTLELDLDSDASRRESRMAITHAGFDTLAREMIRTIRRIKTIDPESENTQVALFRDARINGRRCIRIHIRHPRRDDRFDFHTTNVFVDEELHTPIRVDAHDWPRGEGKKAPMIAEFTYLDLKFNVGLKDADFDPAVLRRPTRKRPIR